MLRIYKIAKENYKDVKNILEENPYSDDSFSRVGYTLRDGKTLGVSTGDVYYLIIAADEGFIHKADAKLKDKAKVIEDQEYNKVKEAYEAMESSAESGFGALFG